MVRFYHLSILAVIQAQTFKPVVLFWRNVHKRRFKLFIGD